MHIFPNFSAMRLRDISEGDLFLTRGARAQSDLYLAIGKESGGESAPIYLRLQQDLKVNNGLSSGEIAYRLNDSGRFRLSGGAACFGDPRPEAIGKIGIEPERRFIVAADGFGDVPMQVDLDLLKITEAGGRGWFMANWEIEVLDREGGWSPLSKFVDGVEATNPS